jgi:hypothetical protein
VSAVCRAMRAAACRSGPPLLAGAPRNSDTSAELTTVTYGPRNLGADDGDAGLLEINPVTGRDVQKPARAGHARGEGRPQRAWRPADGRSAAAGRHCGYVAGCQRC